MTTTPAALTPPTLRVIGSATIAFGLVACPVKLYSAHNTEDGISFNMHHDEDSGRLKQQYICLVCNQVVDREHTVKGYEHAKGQSVLLSATELAALDAVATNQVTIETYVPGYAVDPRFYDKTYYLGPDKGSERAYQLIADALQATGHVAIAMYARRGKEKLVALQTIPGSDRSARLVLHELHYAQEVRSIDGVPATGIHPSSQMLELATEIIERAASPAFEPEQYADKVQASVMKLIEAKVAGGEIVVAPEPASSAPADVLQALAATLDTMPPRAKIVPKRTRKARVQAVAAKKKANATKRKAVSR